MNSEPDTSFLASHPNWLVGTLRDNPEVARIEAGEILGVAGPRELVLQYIARRSIRQTRGIVGPAGRWRHVCLSVAGNQVQLEDRARRQASFSHRTRTGQVAGRGYFSHGG